MAAYHRNVTPWPEDGAGTRSGGCRMFWLQGEKTMRRSGLFLVLTVLLWAVSGVGMAQDRPAPVNGDSALKARKSVGKGKSVSVRVDLGGRRIIKKKNEKKTT